MANVSKANMLDKDIRNLEILPKQYKKKVGNPKELYIKIYQGIYSVAKARRDAIEIIKNLIMALLDQKINTYLAHYLKNIHK